MRSNVCKKQKQPDENEIEDDIVSDNASSGTSGTSSSEESDEESDKENVVLNEENNIKNKRSYYLMRKMGDMVVKAIRGEVAFFYAMFLAWAQCNEEEYTSKRPSNGEHEIPFPVTRLELHIIKTLLMNGFAQCCFDTQCSSNCSC